MLFSFNAGRSRSVWQGFSLRWWIGDPNASLLRDESLRMTTVNSLVLAVVTVVVTLPLGTMLAIGLQRWRGRGAGSSSALVSAPLVTPELVLGAALLLVFTNLYAAVPLGRPAQIIGHITLNLSAVVVTVRARLLMIGSSYEDAARDLGASRRAAIRLVLVPLLRPAIVAAGVIVFATSIDDFIVSSFLSSGVTSGTDTSADELPAPRPRQRCSPIASIVPSGRVTTTVTTASTRELTVVMRSESSCNSDAFGSPIHHRNEKPCHTERLRPALNENSTAISKGKRDHTTYTHV
ncbi:MAG: ABC transporter permease, partial [Actinomycetota bacterium]